MALLRLERVAEIICQHYSKEALPYVCMEVPVFQFVPIATCSVAGHHWKEPATICLTLTL